MECEFSHKTWEKVAKRRRLLLLCLILISTIIASGFMAQTLPHKGAAVLEFVLLLFFAILYAWISVGFWASISGFIVLMRGNEHFLGINNEKGSEAPISGETRTALLFPVYNEAVDRAYAGLYTAYRSLQQANKLEVFDFFILSDSTDPDKWIEEEAAWNELCQSIGGKDRIFYRNRRVNSKRKSGNIADFCRRWGYKYKYMIIFDADSIMSGPTLFQMVAIMEERPSVGILQTSPKAVRAKTMFARLQQFANHLYTPIFSAGLHFWQLGDAQYWGHNAIIRVAPFMKHCALPVLTGKPPLGGTILSHDFVEAALMRRAGWDVWLACDLSGSYEEVPTTLLDELQRDRRWCQGNMQHLRLLFTKGIFPAHRALFLSGAMSYVSGLLWFIFLILSTGEAIFEALKPPEYFPAGQALFPHWPVWNLGWAITLGISTATLLFFPKILAVVLVVAKQKRAKEFGGLLTLLFSTMVEIIFSALFAPIRMIFHSKFVLSILVGRAVEWKTQQRTAMGTSWSEALHFHGSGMFLGVMWSLVVLLIVPSFFWWLTPILLALIVSIPLSVWSSRSTIGRKFQQIGLFLTPEEISPSPEQHWVDNYQEEYQASSSPLPVAKEHGFIRAVIEPCVHVLHLSLLRKERLYSVDIQTTRKELRDTALSLGPEALTLKEKKALLCDPSMLKSLHKGVWNTWDETLARKWGVLIGPQHRFPLHSHKWFDEMAVVKRRDEIPDTL